MDENADGGTVIAVTTENADSVTVDDDRFEVAGDNLKLKDGISLDFEADTSPITVTITATAAGGDASATVDVSINDLNEDPSIMVEDGAVDENAAGAVVGAVSATDPDAGDTHTFEVSDDRFEVAGGMLKLKDGMSLDHESEGSVTVTVTVTDAGGLSASGDVTVTVNNVNEAPSAPALRGLPQSVDENDDGAIVASLETGSDPDGDSVSFSVDDQRFEVIAGGVLKLKDGVTLDFEGDGGSVDIVVTAVDPSGLASDPTIVTVAIEDENEAPSITAADTDVDENDAGAVLTAITLSDPDAGDSHTVRIDDFRFTVVTDENGGMWIGLKDGESLNHEDEASVPLTLTVTDAGGLSGTVDVTVTVNDVNEAPTVSVGQGVTPDGVIAAPTVDENNAGAPLGEISVSDPDAGDTYTLSVSDPRFEAAQDHLGGWWVKLRDDQSIDFETEESVALTVTVTDAGGLTDTADVMITVRNVDEAPSAPVVRDGGLNVDENDEGAVVTSLADSTDPEGDDITYTVDDDRFEITSGLVLKLKDGTSLDHETEDSVTLTLTASDPAGNTSEATMVDVAVNDVNEAPSISVADGTTPDGMTAASTIDENAAGVPVGEITISDPDDGDTLALSVSDDRFEAKQDNIGGWWVKLKDGMSLDHETDESVTVTVTVTDAAGLTASTDVTVTVSDVNEGPSISVADGTTPDGMTAASTIDENAAGVPVGEITFSDPDDGDTHTLSVSDDRFEAKQDAVGGWWVKLKDGMSLDHETDESVTVTVTVTDAAGLSASTDVTVTVSDVNEAPTIEAADGSVDENAAGAIVGAVTASDVDDGDSHTYAVSDERFEVANGMLKLKDDQSLDHETDESVTVTVTVTDSGNLSASTDVTVAVNDVNEAPTIEAADGSVDENAAGAMVGAVTSSDVDDGDTLTYSVSDDRFEVAGGMLKLKDDQSLDHETDASVAVTVTVTDSGGLSASADVTVTATNVDEGTPAPTVVNADNLAVDENEAGAAITSVDAVEDPEGGVITYHVDDDRFEIDSGRVLSLKEGMALDHESEGSVTLAITARDEAGNESEAAVVTIAVNDVNEAPSASATVANITPEAGAAVNQEVDLLALFSDPDDGDSVGGWRLSGNPSWLELLVVYGTDEDGATTVTGYLRGTPPTTGPESFASHMATITANDDDGLTVSASFHVIVDDGNDAVERVNLLNSDGSVNINNVVDVDENDASGKVFGKLDVVDGDNDNHPHGQHEVTVDDPRFEIRKDDAGDHWLALKEGETLDHEKDDLGYVTVRVTAVDMNGEKNAQGNYLGKSGTSDLITVNINDVNEAPVPGTIGNWWVTVNNALQESAVTKGSWLEFKLDTEGPGAAFTDPEGDKLTYSISGPTWLQIDEDDGTFTNVAEMTPNRGASRVTVTATDEDGLTATRSFTLYVAESAEVDDDPNVSNHQPTISLTTGSSQYTEGSGKRRIATIRAEDDDQDLEGHLFAISKVEIVSVLNLATLDAPATDPNNQPEGDDFDEDDGYAAAFRLTDPVKSGNTLTYGLVVEDTEDVLNYEAVLNVRLVVRVTDGAGKSSDVTVDVRINDANEAPYVENELADENLTVEQSHDAEGDQDDGEVELIYINLNQMWDDPDIGDVDATLTFRASSSTSWIDILHGPGRWQTVQLGPDGVTGSSDDVSWQDGATEPDGSDFVVIIELDRTGRNNDQDASGSFTITATDRGGASKTETFMVTVTDENLPIADDAVDLSGGSNPRQGGRLTPRFNEARDPDLAGSDKAALVVYTWRTHDADPDTDNDGELSDAEVVSGDVVRVTTSNAPLTLTQAHVDKFVSVSVSYYEIDEDGELTAAQDGGTDVTDRAVADSQDRGSVHFNILTGVGDGSDGETLRAEVSIDDADGVPTETGAVTYTWEVSDNGRGGWTDVKEPDPDTTTPGNEALYDRTYDLANGDGKYYRLVVTYTDNAGGSERHASDPVQIGNLPATEQSLPQTAVTGSPNPGATLRVNAPGALVQWQRGVDGNDDGDFEDEEDYWVDIPGATGNLGLTASDAGSSVRAVVTYTSSRANDPAGATAIVASPVRAIGGTPTPIPPLTIKENHYFEASVDVPHAAVSGEAPGQTASIERTVDWSDLFEDPDSARLSFAVTSTFGDDEATGDPDTLQITGEQGVLVFEETSGKLTFVSDVTHTHDGNPADGQGNVITLAVVASDDTETTATANVHLRINVAPTGINIVDQPITSIAENDPAEGGELVATLNVVDENQSGSNEDPANIVPPHAFGSHTITITGRDGLVDDRFEVTNSGNGPTDSDGDASTWELRLKKGATFDYETDDMDTDTDGIQLVLTLTATDGGGLSTPVATAANGYPASTVTITITNDEDDDDDDSSTTDVPGLVDDENNDADETMDDDSDDPSDHDDDNDGGSQLPPPGMSIGQVESIVDSMDVFEQDLLEDFMFMIDDVDAA